MNNRRLAYIRIIVVFMLSTMLTVCVFPYADVPYMEHDAMTQDSGKKIVREGKMRISSADLPRSVMGREMLENKTSGRNDNLRTGNRILSFLWALFIAAQIYFAAILFVIILIKSDITPRFSIILFLHRSDGKKSALVLA